MRAQRERGSRVRGNPGAAILDGVTYCYVPPKAPWQVIDAKQPGVPDWGVLASEAISHVWRAKGVWELPVKHKRT